jgi:hypothetical protein
MQGFIDNVPYKCTQRNTYHKTSNRNPNIHNFLEVVEHEINQGYQVIQYKDGISSITPKATTVGLYQKFNTVRATRDQPERISVSFRRSEDMTYTQPTK